MYSTYGVHAHVTASYSIPQNLPKRPEIVFVDSGAYPHPMFVAEYDSLGLCRYMHIAPSVARGRDASIPYSISAFLVFARLIL